MPLGEVESKWVRRWEESRAFEADPDPSRKKVFVTFPYPYMNGPLHLGHAYSALRVDVYARYKRMKGFNVLFPWAWHWTGQPIVSAAERLAKADPLMLKEFRDIEGIPDSELPKFRDPLYMAEYYTEHNRDAVKLLGLSIDWRREFHTSSHEPAFNRFVEWQYRKLKELGYVVQGTHPVVWCPHDASPTGDHDRLEGEGVAPEEFTLVKFKLEREDKYLVAATFRPETIFGATNLWVNPEGFYSEVIVNGESWIVSNEAAMKLSEQGRAVRVIRRLDGLSLLSSRCVVPMVGRVVPVLPALFVDTDNATGVVYSVPAHAPFDWLALRDLKTGHEKLKAYKVKSETVDGTNPISIIALDGYGQFPAVDAINTLKAVDQLDPKGEEATKEIYSKEFHLGVMKENCLSYSGMKVSDAKGAVTAELSRLRLADKMWELPQKVICRCMTKCLVKVLQDQWFLRYSDPDWKGRSLQCVAEAEMLPEEARQWFVESVKWIREWPCARKVGLGTPLPWDKEWIVETLSDSTVYMAFYTISHIIKANSVGADSLVSEVFDYAFLGTGDLAATSAKSGIPAKVLDAMRAEFNYWYPVDLRNSAKELVPNHLTFFIMQHVALFKPSQWPRGIGVNGMMLMEGVKMSKSKGNVVPITAAIEQFGADTVRATLLSSGEGMDDPDWRTKNADDVQGRISSLPAFLERALNASTDREEMPIDRWLVSTLQQRISLISTSVERLKTRTAFQAAFFDTWNDLRWYLKRTTPRKETLKAYSRAWSLLLAPFVPFTAEQLNESLGGKGLASVGRWPEPDSHLVDVSALLGEWAVERTIADVKGILAVVKGKPTKASIYPAPGERLRLFKKVARGLADGLRDSDIIKQAVGASPPVERQLAASSAVATLKHIRSLGDEVVYRLLSAKAFDEEAVLREAAPFIAAETGIKEVEVLAFSASVTAGKKALNPLPLKPAILLE
jgi:leucyl-tRNA synthetase